MSKFHVGDIVIGNAEASDHYSITKEGWRGIVTRVYDEPCFEASESGTPTNSFTLADKYFNLVSAAGETRNEQTENVFHVGDHIIGTAAASTRYGITRQGWRGIVTKVFSARGILVKSRDSSETFDVDAAYFTLDESDGWKRPGSVTPRVCSDCGRIIEEDEEWYVTYDGYVICQDCYDSSYFTCEHCGQVHHVDDEIEIHNCGGQDTFLVCSDCACEEFYVCDECGEHYSREDVYTDDYGNCVCADCYESEGYGTCESCGRISTDLVYDEDADEYFCDCCASRRRSQALHDYSYKPYPEFQHMEDEPSDNLRYFGVELEVDKGDDRRTLCDNLAGLNLPIYMKTDGSLDCGVEVVTHPCSLKYHLGTELWSTVSAECKAFNFLSHKAGTCGLHIHVNRDSLGEQAMNEERINERQRTIAKIIAAVDAMWEDLVTFARRSESEISHWANRPYVPSHIWGYEDDDDDTQKCLDIIRSNNSNRYLAVNLRNGNTIEFRIFKGTLNVNTIKASIQFTDNLCEYAKTHTLEECRAATLADIVRFNPTDVLRAYCEDRGLSV